MPNLRNAEKALRQSKVRAARNQVVADEIHSLRRTVRKLIEKKEVTKAKEILSTVEQKIDKAVVKGLFKKNKAARTKSRIAKAIARAEK